MADTDRIIKLAAIIREVDGNHNKGAAALAESILDHPSFHECCNAPAPPADGEVAELAAWLYQLADKCSCNCRRGIRPHPSALTRAAELLQRQVLVPVSVSERPWEREGWRDGSSRCWWSRSESDGWSAEAVADSCEFLPRAAGLPARALPLPEVKA